MSQQPEAPISNNSSGSRVVHGKNGRSHKEEDETLEPSSRSPHGVDKSPIRPSDADSATLAPAAAEPANNQDIFGSHLPSKNTYRTIRSQSPMPKVDKTFILALAHSGSNDGKAKAQGHHISIYLQSQGGDLSVLKRVEADIAKNVAGIARQVSDLSRLLSSTARHHDTVRKNEPWGIFDRVRALVCAVLLVLCAGAGANTLAQIMVGSYIAGFENYSRNLLFSFLVVAFPVVIECFIQRTFTEAGKRLMRAGVALAAITAFGFWVWSFAKTFSLAGASTSDIVNAIVQSAGSDPAQKINTLTIFQIICEVLVAAICALELQHLFEIHLLSDRIANPQFTKTQNDLTWWRQRQREEEELLGQARGRIVEIEEGQKVFVETAVALYDLAHSSAAQHHKAMALLNQ
jgi:hypothetical protein